MSDPILEAKTVGQFMAAVNEVYGRDIPTSFGAGTELEQIWEAEIKVSKEPSPGILYQANGTTPLSIDAVRFRIVPRRRMQEQAHAEAVRQFCAQ